MKVLLPLRNSRLSISLFLALQHVQKWPNQLIVTRDNLCGSASVPLWFPIRDGQTAERVAQLRRLGSSRMARLHKSSKSGSDKPAKWDG